MRTTINVASMATRDQMNKLYCTSDGLAFLDEQEAVNHADELADKAIASMTGEQADAEILNIDTDNWLKEMEELLNGLESDAM